MTPGRVGYLLYDMRTECPSQPDSMVALLSPVPRRQSMRLLRKSSPQFRMAQLVPSVDSQTQSYFHLHLRLQAV
jgi:hypothetical protein